MPRTNTPAIDLLVAQFRSDPSKFLSENVGKMADITLARVLNRARWYCRFFDTNRWTQMWVRRLAYNRNDQDLSAEIGALRFADDSQLTKEVR